MSQRIGQPKGLYPLFFTEMWERFGFYTVQTILILYMSKGLLLTDNASYMLYGVFSSLLYLTPVAGGYLADRFMGYKRAIILGAVLLALGYAVIGLNSEKSLFWGLSIVIIANGFFKPNVSSIVGDLYKTEDDPRRDGGFILFYMGINIGSLIPPIFAGALVRGYGWGSGFFIAAIGMIIALVTFISRLHPMKKIGNLPEKSPLHKPGMNKIFYTLLTLGILILIGLVHILFHYPKEGNLILIFATLAIIGTVLFFIFKESNEQRKKLYACLILILISIGFWAIYNQTFTSLMLFAERNMSKSFLGLTIDAEFTQFFNPFFIILLSPFLSKLWIKLDREGANPSTPAKFTLGVLCIAIGFFVLYGGNRLFNDQGISSAWWLVLSYFIQTIGELCLSPIGLAMITRLAPKHLVGMMMGVWFLTQAAAFAIGGFLATLSNVPKNTTTIQSLQIYDQAFLIYGLYALALTIVSFALIPFLKGLIEMPPGYISTPKK
jgi:POT family proton-dependent oligopeptide transporter